MRRRAARSSWRTGLALAALAACAAPPPAPFEPPALAPAWTHHAGSLLTGPRADGLAPAVDADPAHALALRASVEAVESLPADWPRLASRARLVVTDIGDRPLLGVARLLDGALIADGAGAPAPDVAPGAGGLLAALPPGTTAVLDVDLGVVSPLRDVRLMVSRDDLVTVAVLARGVARASDDEEAPEAITEARELVVVQAPLATDGAPFGLAVPLAQPGHPRAGLVFTLRIAPAAADDAAHAAATTAAVDDVHRSATESRVATAELTVSESFLRQVISAFGALRDSTSRRSALAFLSGASGAPLCGDLTLLADVATLDDLVARVSAGGRDPAALVADGGGLGWLLERSAYDLLTARASQGPLPPELQAELLRHAGEAGRFPSTLQDAVAACGSLSALQARLVVENRIFLEDATAAARVRASEWLAARGKLPAGFDPLASLSERRAALARDEAAQGAEAAK